jgi:protein disulfide-isomerase
MAFTKKINDMKKILIVCTLLIGSLNLYSQENDGWLINVDNAIEKSYATGKPILTNFTGSDWCSWCIKLKKEVFVTPAFKEWDKENVIILEIDSPRRQQNITLLAEKMKNVEGWKTKYQNLTQTFGVRGYPTIILFNIKESEKGISINPLGKMNYMRGGPTPWIAQAKTILKNK